MQFFSKPIEEHEEVPLADDGRWEQLIDRWAARALGERPREQGAEEGNACYLALVGEWHEPAQREAQLAELLALVQAQGDRVVGHEALRPRRIDPRTYISPGAARALAARAREQGANLLVIDAELSPSQTRNLEDATGLAISDREVVILNVFLKHARTRKARIQVEIAHLEYLRPRIRGLGLEMDQQAGGMMYARGPGETASELLARQLDGRLELLRKAFEKLKRAGENQRKRRRACERVVLVGYTNAGKTSLMNALTGAGLSARDMPFETLDTTSRSLTRHGGDVVLSDTVGFIRRLPARLLASFESTLAEAREASLLVLVIDASDPEWEMHVETTETVLARLGAGELPRYYVFNKRDRLEHAPAAARLEALSGGRPYALLSSGDEAAVAALKRALIAAVRHEHRRARLFFPYAATAALTRVYAECRVHESEADARGLWLEVEGHARVVDELEKTLAGAEEVQA
ncbi:MAG: GTPase HflX [Myxococcales bacterium]|nr:GTPase HflX [Myxococcales bacterium]